MAEEQAHTCPECQGMMAPISLLDQVSINGRHQRLEYALPGEKPSFWRGRFPVAGTVAAFMCGACGRITLYGVPKSE